MPEYRAAFLYCSSILRLLLGTWSLLLREQPCFRCATKVSQSVGKSKPAPKATHPFPDPQILRIVFLSPAAHQGGAEAVLLDVLKLLRKSRSNWELYVLVGEDGPLLAKIRAMGVASEVLDFPRAVRSLERTDQLPRRARRSSIGKAGQPEERGYFPSSVQVGER